MTALDVKARASALRLLNKFGKRAVYTVRTEGAYDPATGAAANTETTVTLRVYPSSPNQRMLEKGVQADQMVLLIAASALGAHKPTALDRVTLDPKDYIVQPVEAVWSGEEVALWFVAIKSA